MEVEKDGQGSEAKRGNGADGVVPSPRGEIVSVYSSACLFFEEHELAVLDGQHGKGVQTQAAVVGG